MERFWAANVLKKIDQMNFIPIFPKKALIVTFTHMNHNNGEPKVAAGLPFETGPCHMAGSMVNCAFSVGYTARNIFWTPRSNPRKNTQMTISVLANFFPKKTDRFEAFPFPRTVYE